MSNWQGADTNRYRINTTAGSNTYTFQQTTSTFQQASGSGVIHYPLGTVFPGSWVTIDGQLMSEESLEKLTEPYS